MVTSGHVISSFSHFSLGWLTRRSFGALFLPKTLVRWLFNFMCGLLCVSVFETLVNSFLLWKWNWEILCVQLFFLFLDWDCTGEILSCWVCKYFVQVNSDSQVVSVRVNGFSSFQFCFFLFLNVSSKCLNVKVILNVKFSCLANLNFPKKFV